MILFSTAAERLRNSYDYYAYYSRRDRGDIYNRGIFFKFHWPKNESIFLILLLHLFSFSVHVTVTYVPSSEIFSFRFTSNIPIFCVMQWWAIQGSISLLPDYVPLCPCPWHSAQTGNVSGIWNEWDRNGSSTLCHTEYSQAARYSRLLCLLRLMCRFVITNLSLSICPGASWRCWSGDVCHPSLTLGCSSNAFPPSHSFISGKQSQPNGWTSPLMSTCHICRDKIKWCELHEAIIKGLKLSPWKLLLFLQD